MIKYVIIASISLLICFENRCINIPSDDRTRPVLEFSCFSKNNQFQIHYDIEGSNAPDLSDLNSNDIPDYVEEVAIIAEDSRHTLINVMGYLPEPDDEDGIYDIYIVNQTAWGWNVPESSVTGASYIKIDNDYLGTAFNSSFCFESVDKMRISVAHEFFHAIQRAYRPNYNTDHDFLLEMSSMWFEDLMVPNCNDYLSFTNYSSGIFKNPSQKFDGSESLNSATFGYSMALFGHYLSRLVDPSGIQDERESSIIREIWEDYQTQSNQEDINAAGQSIIDVISSYGSSFSDIWIDFIVKNMFSGRYSYFNQDYYYYYDQQYMNTFTFNYPSNSIGVDYEYETSLQLDTYSVNILKFNATENQIIESAYSNTDCLINSASIIGEQNQIFNSQDLGSPIVLNSSDIIYFVSILDDLECDDLNFYISSQSVPVDSVSIYPNPIYYGGHISVQIDSHYDVQDIMIEIYDVSGRLVLKQENIEFNNPIDININELISSSGVYFLKVYYNKKLFMYKFSYIR